MHENTNGFGARYELYVTDGTASPDATRNYHGIDIGTPPSSIFTLAVFDQQPNDIAEMFVPGNFVIMRNVLVKRERGVGPLELKWSEKVTSEQKAAGWKNRKITLVPPHEHRATEINRWVFLFVTERTTDMVGGSTSISGSREKVAADPRKRFILMYWTCLQIKKCRASQT